MPIVVSLANFEETNPKCVISSPRSLQACKQEGVLPQELQYKPPEAFQEKCLSPRLVKLRYDFFEAKRRDLLAAARRTRDQLIADEKREKGEEQHQLHLLAKDSGLTKGAILALNGDTLAYERKKLLKAQEIERKWLENALNNELDSLKKLEGNNNKAELEAKKEADAARAAALKLKELNDRRAADEERKALEAEARQKLEKQIAKEEFHKQQEELARKAEMEAAKQRENYRRQCEEAERKKQMEIEKAEKREAAYREQEARKQELRAQDLRRQEAMAAQKEEYQMQMRDKQEARDLRIYQSIQNNLEIEQRRREEFEERCRQDALREERLAQVSAERQEESAKRSFQLMMRRRCIQDEATRRAEDRRNGILERQEETELRLLEHEQKKERYLDFKRELDGLRSKNKEINVERQRRKEEALREKVAEEVRRKDEKTECLQSERQRLWQLRRSAQSEAYRAREIVKAEIIRQRIASKYDSKKVARQLSGLIKQDIFHPQVVHGSTSMPSLRPMNRSSTESAVEAS
eukprot:TRINITY_DN54051_c0_g1_i1.p1 TRINITY_DN54051_c0_g1~~TRINITY_DN54051_c0_g1_i1.p1  ORF type:complete len:567 (+),score=167.90 TRINITY_DN54051_c0_g1_i1:130-1701(+)